jgi:hypothetical protein
VTVLHMLELGVILGKIQQAHRQHVSANFPEPGICVSRCADSVPQWPCGAARAAAALAAVLPLSDAAALKYRATGHVDVMALDESIREAIAEALAGQGRDEIPVGQCEFCQARNVRLVAVLTADTDQRVCADCHEDPRVPTTTR